jgi:hypothetical protein
MQALDQHGHRARTTADIQHAMPSLKRRLIDEDSSGFFTSEQLDNGVIKRQCPVVPCGGKIRSLGFWLHFNSSADLVYGIDVPIDTLDSVDLLSPQTGHGLSVLELVR